MTRVEPTWEFREIFFSRDSDREETRQFLTFKADRGRWELDRTKIYRDGRKKIRLRRKVYRVEKAM
ncbi:MAG: DUF5703 family protein [Candidatus Nanopelagicales bacterium]|jgi:hypothetical protein|tara:strand:+ start:279 stop:476 length:198 start_codon:yes stop_codon:yes gene_type:complete